MNNVPCITSFTGGSHPNNPYAPSDDGVLVCEFCGERFPDWKASVNEKNWAVCDDDCCIDKHRELMED